MICLPEQLFAAAQAIAAISENESMYRATVNRAYYASYHCCRDYHAGLPYLGTIGATKGRHEQLISQLANPSLKLTSNGRARSTAIGKYLRLICDSRVHADYDLNVEMPKEQMVSMMSIAIMIRSASTVSKGTLPAMPSLES